MRQGGTKRYSKQTYEDATLIHYATTQVSIKRGLKQWGKRAVKAVLKELDQFHTKKTFRLLYPSDIMEQDKADALEQLLFLK